VLEGSRRTSAPTARSTWTTSARRARLGRRLAPPAFDRSPTERILAALDHPHVDCIGHLTGRKLNRRPGADVDVEQVVARAVETGTALEINSQPDRLDMRDVHARLAGEAGVLVPITTDAHSTRALGYASSVSRRRGARG
jgi:histidinol phosphatase-like PHP family hydrolase